MRPTTMLSEHEALRRAQQGDPAAFECLYHLHSPRVYSLCLRMVKNPAEAEDLTQDTFVAVLRGIRNFRGQSAFTTWLHRVTRNTVLMCFRKKRLKESSLEEISRHQEDEGRAPTELGMSDLHLEGTADRLLLQNAVGGLSSRVRMVFLLHDVHGYQHGEIAALLGCATGTSKSQLHKARVRVRETLRRSLLGAKRSTLRRRPGAAESAERRAFLRFPEPSRA